MRSAGSNALEQAQANRDQADARVRARRSSPRAHVEAAETDSDVLKAQQGEAAQTLKQLQTALAKAER